MKFAFHDYVPFFLALISYFLHIASLCYIVLNCVSCL